MRCSAHRMVSDEVWTAAKARQEQTRHTVKSAGHPGRARRPRYVFSGLTKCGVCGAGFIMARGQLLRVGNKCHCSFSMIPQGVDAPPLEPGQPLRLTAPSGSVRLSNEI